MRSALPSQYPFSITSSPSSRNARVSPPGNESGFLPPWVSSIIEPKEPGAAPESVPEPSRSPGRRLQPLEVWCATICATVQYESRKLARESRAGPLGALLVGVAFAFGWTPCIGPILAGILAVAASRETVGEGVLLLAIYSLGLGVPFLLTSMAINRFFSVTAQIRRHYHAIELVSGGLLVAIGVLIFTGQLTIIVRYLEPYLPVY